MNTANMYFTRFRQTLDSQMKLATEQGIGTVKRQAQPISAEQEKSLWKKGILNSTTALGLSKEVYFYNFKAFGLRSRDEYRNLKAEQYSFGTDEVGNFVTFHGRVSKNVTGGLQQRNIQLKEVKQYDTDKDISVYKIFRKYMECIGDTGLFYLRPLAGHAQGEIQFSDQGLGLNSLGSYIKDMMTEAGYSGHYTGHSGKVTLATTLYHQVDEQLIKERTGHRSDAVRNYKRTSFAQQKVISEILDIPVSTDPKKENILLFKKKVVCSTESRRHILKDQTPDGQLLDGDDDDLIKLLEDFETAK